MTQLSTLQTIRPAYYSVAAKSLHWGMALVIFGMIPAGLAIARMDEGPLHDQLYGLHEEFGFLVLLAAIVRIFVRVRNGAPAPAQTLTRLERIASVATHHLLYVLIVAMPLLGWAGVSAYGAHISMFGLFDVPSILPKNEPLSDVLFRLHNWGAYTIIALLFAHIGGALNHFVVKCDSVMQRMMPKV